ncbi:uncharacterized protein [Heptranchias perlo]|uniref:uncharacterized protein n=1 Tax=Heptranchias perlo TaxID=212740 RepID=UPI003559E342
MASDENVKDLVFEGYLKKRKDKMRFAWAKYWFRLQNTTLFFFTEKGSETCHLRGQYYIYTVQSVRETKATNHEYPFEIVMKNGKRKLLSAATSDLRAVWMEFLWKAMQLPGPGKKNSACTWHDIPCLIQRAESLCQDRTKRENSSGSFTSTDAESQDCAADTTSLLKSSVAPRDTSFQYLDILVEPYVSSSSVTSSNTREEDVDNEIVPSSKDTACEQLPSKHVMRSEVAPSLLPKVTSKVNCQSGIYDVPKPVIEKVKVNSNVQPYPDESFISNSNSNTGLLDEIISDCRISTCHWLDSTDTQNDSFLT